MELSFQEKSAWGLLIGILTVSAFYFPAAFDIASRVPQGAQLIIISGAGVVALIIIEAVYHAFIALSSRDERLDERDALIDLKAERNGGFMLGGALVMLVGHILFNSVMSGPHLPTSLEIAVWILLALTLAEVAKLGSQIWYYRRGC